ILESVDTGTPEDCDNCLRVRPFCLRKPRRRAPTAALETDFAGAPVRLTMTAPPAEHMFRLTWVCTATVGALWQCQPHHLVTTVCLPILQASSREPTWARRKSRDRWSLGTHRVR